MHDQPSIANDSRALCASQWVMPYHNAATLIAACQLAMGIGSQIRYGGCMSEQLSSDSDV